MDLNSLALLITSVLVLVAVVGIILVARRLWGKQQPPTGPEGAG